MKSTRSAFTLVELLIVVAILGIMAMVVVPRYSEASGNSRGAALADQARILRDAINVYRAQHQDRFPGVDSSGLVSDDALLLAAQLTTYTNVKGDTSSIKSAVYRYGPYLPSMPANPISGLQTISLVSGAPSPDDATGWFYEPSSGRLWPNNVGSDKNGKSYLSY